MTIHAMQHRPSFIDTDAPRRAAAVPSVEALLALPWIARWAEDGVGGRAFSRWSVANPGADSPMLIAEYDGGDHWWVVAYLTSDAPIPLPTWEPSAAGLARVDRWNRGETS